MPPATFYDHKDTLNYIPKHHKTKGLTEAQIKIFKALEKRYIHEGRTIDESYLENTTIRQDLAAINFDCLLDIDEPICPRFILEFYASVNLHTNDEGLMSLSFMVNHSHFSISLDNFAQVLGIPNRGTCVYSDKWSLSILERIDDRIHPYDTPLTSKEIIRDHLFRPRVSGTRYTRQGNEVDRDPFSMELNELKPQFAKWEEILRANVISSIGNRDHINACLCYMLYSISTRQPFNLAYYIAKRMTNIPVHGRPALPYGMLLTRLFRAFAPIPPNDKGFCPDYTLVPHIFVPLSDFRVAKTSSSKGKRPHPPTSSSSSMSEDDGLPNSRLNPLEYRQQLPSIPNESAEFKQTKGMFKCLGRFLNKINKKLDK